MVEECRGSGSLSLPCSKYTEHREITVTEFIPQLSLPQGTVCERLIFLSFYELKNYWHWTPRPVTTEQLRSDSPIQCLKGWYVVRFWGDLRSQRKQKLQGYTWVEVFCRDHWGWRSFSRISKSFNFSTEGDHRRNSSLLKMQNNWSRNTAVVGMKMVPIGL